MFTRYHISRQFLSFAIIGVLNTCVHSMVVIGLVELRTVPPVLANVCAFCVANQVSFFLNCRFTFRVPSTLSFFGRFFVVSLASLAITVLLSGYAEWMGWHYKIGLLLVIAIGPPLTFVLQKYWAFKVSIEGEKSLS